MYTDVHEREPVGGAGVPAEHRRRFELLKQEFLAKSDLEYWKAEWWWALRLDGRRMLCTLAGLDNSEEFCNRTWERISDGNRAVICATAREWAQKLAVMRRI
jgi:hypothetical protein